MIYCAAMISHQGLIRIFPIETAWDMYLIWEGNFLDYWKKLNIYRTNTSDE